MTNVPSAHMFASGVDETVRAEMMREPQPSDWVVYANGTTATVLAVDGDELALRVRTPGGAVAEERCTLAVWQMHLLGAVELWPVSRWRAANGSPVVMSGERWALTYGDALAWLAGLDNDSVDAVITDPPYSSGGRSLTERKQPPSGKYLSVSSRSYPEFEGDGRDQRSWIQWMAIWLGQALRVARPGVPLCMFTDWRQQPATTDALQAGGWIWRGTLSWNKTGAARPQRGRFTQQDEFIIWGSKGPMPASRQCLSDSNTLPGAYCYRVDPRDKFHTTGKPTPLLADIVRICEPGGTILDPFAGSGTTGVAALQMDYRFLGCEISPAYANIAAERLRAVRGHPLAEQLALDLSAAVVTP